MVTPQKVPRRSPKTHLWDRFIFVNLLPRILQCSLPRRIKEPFIWTPYFLASAAWRPTFNLPFRLIVFFMHSFYQLRFLIALPPLFYFFLFVLFRISDIIGFRKEQNLINKVVIIDHLFLRFDRSPLLKNFINLTVSQIF